MTRSRTAMPLIPLLLLAAAFLMALSSAHPPPDPRASAAVQVQSPAR